MKRRKIKIETTEEWQNIYKADGHTFVSTSYEDLVRQFRNMLFDYTENNKEYMKIAKSLHEDWDGSKLDDSSEEAFVESMIETGYLKHIGIVPPKKVHEEIKKEETVKRLLSFGPAKFVSTPGKLGADGISHKPQADGPFEF